jgi:hypothetical protein
MKKLSWKLLLLCAVLLLPPPVCAISGGQSQSDSSGLDLGSDEALKKWFVQNKNDFEGLRAYVGRMTCDSTKPRGNEFDLEKLKALSDKLHVETMTVSTLGGNTAMLLNKEGKVGYLYVCKQEEIDERKYMLLEKVTGKWHMFRER